MLATNPFVAITSSDKDKVVDRIKEKIEIQLHINDAVNSGKLIILKGAPGVGKSTIINWILKDIQKAKGVEVLKEEFTPSVYNRIRGLNINPTKKMLVILDDFNNVEMLDSASQKKVLGLVNDLARRMGVLLIENRTEGVEKDFKKLGNKFQRYELGGLSYSDLKQVIVNRLNEVRDVPTDHLDPFTEFEYEKIYKKSGGNPRIALLICASLYDQKETSII